MKTICRPVKKRIINHENCEGNRENLLIEKELLKSAVINNLVQEEKRGILFSTQLPDENNNEDYDLNEKDEVYEVKERIERLEIIVRKLVEYLVKGSLNTTT